MMMAIGTKERRNPMANNTKGFASMSAEKKREIASKGGKAAHALGTAHKFSSEEARAAGRVGGKLSKRKKETK